MRKLMMAIVAAAVSIASSLSAAPDEPDTMYLGLVDLDCVRVGFVSEKTGSAADAMPSALRDFLRARLPSLAVRDDCGNYLDLSLVEPNNKCSNLNLSLSRPVRLLDSENARPLVTVVWSRGYTSGGRSSGTAGNLLMMFKDDYLRAGNNP